MMMPTPGRLDRGALLQSFGRCTVDTYGRFQTAADALATATAAYEATPTDATRAAARTAWEGAIDVCQRAEMHRYGPAGGFDTVGGQNLRTEIYAWPDVNRCLIEQQLVSQSYASNFASISTNARGLATLEYLLFHPGNDNACAPTEAINATGAWAAIAPAELTPAQGRVRAGRRRRRRRARRARSPPRGTRAASHAAHAGGARQHALRHAAAGVQRRRRGDLVPRHRHEGPAARAPARVGQLHRSGSCPEALESRWADRGKRHLRNNLAGLRTLLEGCAAGNNLGFDDLLDAAGASTLTAQLRIDLDAADAAVDAIPGDGLAGPFVSNRASLVRAHTAIKRADRLLEDGVRDDAADHLAARRRRP